MTARDQARHNFHRRVPEGDNQERLVCRDCGHVQYDNPKVVVGAVCTWEGRILLCLRDIEPRAGFWTLPAGYLELHESPMDGAMREAQEEARAEIAIDQLLAVYDIPRLSQVQLIYRARLLSPDVAAADETREVGLFDWDDIPWDDIAFPTVHWALRAHREVRSLPSFGPFANPAGDTPDRLERG
ncbi:MAG: NUDIX hydrolase [Rhodospirillaceae bacterium]|jgi:ADP-ribose pyrophosphatase YjhB (NUDIX family)|nr:NUDIX hydrolase [Rhodospirillaceae bacterium]MBT6117328.1 NUDIX hydrolase [Rhodospirillaceae bacterium]